MFKFIAAALLAASLAVLAAAPAQAQQQGQQCPPGLQASGPYCVTPGPTSNCPPGAQPANASCPQGGVAGDRMSSAEIEKLTSLSKESLLEDVNAILRRAGLEAISANRVSSTNTTTGFVVTIRDLSVTESALLSAAGMPVAVVGCVVASCPTGYNTRLDLRRRGFRAAAAAPRLYLPQRLVVLRRGATHKITVKVPRTKVARAKLADARAATIRIVNRVRNTRSGVVTDRTVKTVRVTIAR